MGTADDGEIIVYLHCAENDIALNYNAPAATANYTVLPSADEASAETAMETLCTGGYKKNDLETMAMIMQMLNSAFIEEGAE